MKLTRKIIRTLILEQLAATSGWDGSPGYGRNPDPIRLEKGLGLSGMGVWIAAMAAAEIGEMIDPSKAFVLPVPADSPEGWLTSRPGESRGGGSRVHKGDDWGVEENTALLAIGNGHVVSVETSPDPYDIDGKKEKGDPCGCRITLKIDDLVPKVIYCHVNRVDVSAGEQVKKGQVIGLSGGRRGSACGGSTTGPHLHFSLDNSSDVALYDQLYAQSSGWDGPASRGTPTTHSDGDDWIDSSLEDESDVEDLGIPGRD